MFFLCYITLNKMSIISQAGTVHRKKYIVTIMLFSCCFYLCNKDILRNDGKQAMSVPTYFCSSVHRKSIERFCILIQMSCSNDLKLESNVTKTKYCLVSTSYSAKPTLGYPSNCGRHR